MTILNHQIRLAARPKGMPKASDWKLTSEEIPELKKDEILIKVHYIAVDPVMRLWMNEGSEESVNIGAVMKAFAAGQIEASNNPKFSPGDYVVGYFGVQKYAIVKEEDLTKVDIKIAPLSVFLGALGRTGLTAYFGMLDIGKPKKGDSVVISAAAGAVGTVAGQIAKMNGSTVIGIAGGEKKCKYIVEKLGFDEAIDYKHKNVANELQTFCPKGIDLYFDNVGGEILDIALSQIAFKGRIIICGAISQYNTMDIIKGPSNYLSLLFNHAKMEGFTVYDYFDRFPEATIELGNWIKQHKLTNVETIVDGLETFPETFLKLFKGENLGKLVIKVI